MLYVLMLLCVSLLGVIMVYFSGYLIEASGSWASVFGLITVVNLLGLATFLSFAEARRVDIDLSKGRYHNIHIWEHRRREQSNTIRIWSLWICRACVWVVGRVIEKSLTLRRQSLVSSLWLFRNLFDWREYRKSCRRYLIDLL